MAATGLRYGRKYQTGWNPITAIAMAAFHAGAIAAFFFIDAGAIAAAVVLYCVAGMFGIGMGYHRLLTHRGYRTYRPIEYFLTWCGTLALEGGPIFWVATHRIHHQHSDREGDPHTPREGTWWVHAGWILSGQGLHHDHAVLARYVPDLVRDPVHVALSRWHWTSNVIVGLALLAFGGIPYVLWGIFFRTTVGLHATWLVNSATHKWGSHRFETHDDSTNNWWVALLTFGEGWHNNHHAHPTSARHGLAWYEVDPNWMAASPEPEAASAHEGWPGDRAPSPCAILAAAISLKRWAWAPIRLTWDAVQVDAVPCLGVRCGVAPQGGFAVRSGV